MDGQRLQDGLVGGQRPGVAPLQRVGVGRHLSRPVHDVLPVIAVVGNFPSGGPGGQRGGEALHLDTAVVDVELARHLVAAPLVEAGHRVAVAGTTTVPGVERPGRVGAHELHDDLGPGPVVVPAPPVGPSDHHVDQHLVEPRVGQPEVHEARPGYLDTNHVGRRGGRQVVGQGGAQLAGVPTGDLRRDQGHVGGPVPVIRVGRSL